MKLSKAKTAVVTDAAVAGFTVTIVAGHVEVIKYSAHVRPRIVCGLIIYPDGTALDITVGRLDCARAIRSAADMRRVLGLPVL